jgi:hypothetical protein
MDKLEQQQAVGIQAEHGWSWEKSKLQSAQDLGSVLATAFDPPLVALLWQGRAVLEPDQVEGWLNKRGWVAVSARDAGWMWMKSSAGGVHPRPAKPEDVNTLWTELAQWGAALEAAEIVSGHQEAKISDKKTKRM